MFGSGIIPSHGLVLLLPIEAWPITGAQAKIFRLMKGCFDCFLTEKRCVSGWKLETGTPLWRCRDYLLICSLNEELPSVVCTFTM